MKHAVVFLFLSAGFSVAADDEASKKLLKDIQGTYEIIAAEQAGGVKKLPDRNELLMKISIKGDQFSMSAKSKVESEKTSGTITVDAAKSPAQFDLTLVDGPKKGKTEKGIISVEGDTIKWCFGDENRPTEFKTSKQDKFMMFTLKYTKE